MKWLISLSVAQTALLAALGLKVVAIDMRTGEIAEAAQAQTAPIETAADPSALSWDNARAASVTAEDVRQILREEIAALDTPVRAAAAPARPQQTAEEIKTASTAVDHDINYFRSRGAINEREMATLQAKIAKLPLAERRAALSSLTIAMNKGEIDGWM
ncbi:hypothetical protein [Hyphococcus sp.]|uniref:hypothetical protein n=1 Tax=Hyphococcus sp. TaxID=2038636 RepID=UPI0035C67BA5